jgi:hypothetical protein
VSHAGTVFHSFVANCLRHGGHAPSTQNPDGTNPDRTRALDRGLRLPGGEECEYSAERLSDQFEMRRPVPDVPAVCSSAAKDLGALVIYPTHAMPVRRAQGQNWNNQMQARLVLVVETTNEQSISFFFEQLDIPVVASGEPVDGIGCGARRARQSR